MPLSKSDQARINGAKSRGPKTPEGKARSSLNALKHGRYATNAIVLKNEDPEAFEDLVANYAQIIQPANTVEYHLTRELAAINWLLTRVYAMDTRLLDHEMDMQTPALDSAGLTMQELTRLTAAGRTIVDRSQYPNYLARRAAQLVRARQSTLAFLKDLRKNFPLAESSTEVVPPQPLNPELPTPIEPGSNQTERRADPQVCGRPPGRPLARPGTADGDLRDERDALLRPGRPLALPGTADPLVCAEPPGSAIDNTMHGSNSAAITLDDREAPPCSAPENTASSSVSGEGARCSTPDETVSVTVSESENVPPQRTKRPGAAFDTADLESASSQQPGLSQAEPGGSAPRLKPPTRSAPLLPKAA